MSEFLTQSALAQRLVEKTGVSPETAKNFSTLFFTIIKKGLKDSDTFAVYNFGTFKKTWIERTMGLNPQTGVKIEIPAHWRIKFVPCASVARRINRPYAHLKPKVLKEPKNQKIGPDGLYAKASRIAEENQSPEEQEEEEKIGLLAAAESLRAEKAVLQAESKNGEEESQFEESNKPLSLEEENLSPAEKEESLLAEREPSVVENDEDDDFEDDIAEEKKGRNVKILLLAGAAVLIIILLISLLVRACSRQNTSAKNEADISKKEASEKTEEPENKEEAKEEREAEKPAPEETAENKELPAEKTAEIQQENIQKQAEKEAEALPEEKSSEDFTEISSEALFESFVVPSGGNLHKIAQTKYQNRHLWPLIYSANKDKYPDPDYIGSSANIKIPEKPEGSQATKRIDSAMLDAYNGYLLMCEKQPESSRNEERRQRAIRVIVSGELVQEGFIERNRGRILPEYASLAQNIVKNQYKR